MSAGMRLNLITTHRILPSIVLTVSKAAASASFISKPENRTISVTFTIPWMSFAISKLLVADQNAMIYVRDNTVG